MSAASAPTASRTAIPEDGSSIDRADVAAASRIGTTCREGFSNRRRADATVSPTVKLLASAGHHVCDHKRRQLST